MISVILGDEQSEELRKFIYELALSEIKAARNDAGLDRMLNQTEIAEFVGCSASNIREYEKMGLPFGQIRGRKFYDKSLVKEWILNNHI